MPNLKECVRDVLAEKFMYQILNYYQTFQDIVNRYDISLSAKKMKELWLDEAIHVMKLIDRYDIHVPPNYKFNFLNPAILYPKLDVKKIVSPILQNYNEHVINFAKLLSTISCLIVYDSHSSLRDHIRNKTVYACSVQYFAKKIKVLKFIFPIMIGSQLDILIRKRKLTKFPPETLLNNNDPDNTFETADIAVTFFLINGCLRQLPFFFTNDPTTSHVIKNSIVRCYSYDTDDRGKELSLYVDTIDHTKQNRGELVVVLNDGSKTKEIQGFFDHCEYTIDQATFMLNIYNQRSFDIDNLANKIVVSPGHLFVKLFIKYLFVPLREGNWNVVKSKLAMVTKSIENGTLLHVLSRKTLYHKELGSAPKMVSTPRENHRELGMNGEIYVEKNTGCYREITLQTYPLNPYFSQLIVRQMSNKVKSSAAIAFHPSYIGFICILGTFETKNVGRTNMMVRNTYVSTCNDLDPIAHKKPGQVLYSMLNLESKYEGYFVVINEACVPVTENCFKRINLLDLKLSLVHIECFKDKNFIHIRYKAGLLFKKMKSVWVTSRDELYWAKQLYNLDSKFEIVEKFGFQYITGYHTDINPFFAHNSFPKNILAFNALKNAVLATDQKYNRYFMETFSAYTTITPYHKVVCQPVDDYSSHFVLCLPQVTIAYMSFKGNNQEDSIIIRDNLNAFDCYRFYAIRMKIDVKPPSANIKLIFHYVQGESDDNFLGTLVCHSDNPECEMTVIPQTIHVKIKEISKRETKLFFAKNNFRVLQYDLTKDRLTICVDQPHSASTGDKLCSFHGQKGVMRKVDQMPTFDTNIVPDLLINPYSLFRITPGQILEGIVIGKGQDSWIVHNSDKLKVHNASVFYSKTFYFPVAYWSSEHIYAPKECVLDKILGQAVKGRSRGGGMRLGNMEVMNGMRGNGLASCFEEKFYEHGDKVLNEDLIMIPKSAKLCQEDAKFFKCNIKKSVRQCIEEI